MKLTVTYFRHPRSDQNDRLPHGPNSDIPVTKEGLDKCVHLPDMVAARFAVPQEIISTNYTRGLIGAAFLRTRNRDVKYRVCSDLREYTWCDVAPGQILHPEEKDRLGELLRTDPHPDKRVSDLGETFTQFCARPACFTRELKDPLIENIFAVTHGHWLRCHTVQLLNPGLSTHDLMYEMFRYEVVDNLDAVQIDYDTENPGPPVIQHFKYDEAYMTAHKYPMLEQRFRTDEVTARL